MRRCAERGVALVAVTAGVAILTAAAVGLAVTATSGARLATNALAAAQAEALARSGVAAARAALLDAAATDEPDTLAAPWLRPLDPQPLGAGVLRVTVEDEARRLDLGADPDALGRLLARVGADPLLLDAILDWSDPDDVARPRGAERAWYRTARPPREPANRPFTTVGELLLVRGMDAATLERLRPLVTAAGEGGVNPNTAPPDVLLAAWPNPARVGELVAARARGPVECSDLPNCTTRSTVYRVRATGSIGTVERTAEAMLHVVPGLGADVLAWRWVSDG